MNVVGRQHRQRPSAEQVIGESQADQAGRRHQRHPPIAERGRPKGRQNLEMHEQQLHQHAPRPDPPQRGRISFHAPLQQEQERNRELKNGQKRRQAAPKPGQPPAIPNHVHLQIGDPSQHELEPEQIAPQDHEHQHQIAQIVECLRADHIGQRTPAADDREHDQNEPIPGDQLRPQNQRAGNRRMIFRLQSQNPIDCGQMNRNAIQRAAEARQRVQLGDQPRIAGVVLGARPVVGQPSHPEPKREIHDGPNPKEFVVHIAALLLQQMVGGDRGRIGERIEPPNPEGDRQESQRGQRERFGSRFQQPPRQKAPSAARQIIDEQDHHRTQTDVQAKQIRRQIGAKELGRIEDPADHQRRRSHNADHQRGAHPASQALGLDRAQGDRRMRRRARTVPFRFAAHLVPPAAAPSPGPAPIPGCFAHSASRFRRSAGN